MTDRTNHPGRPLLVSVPDDELAQALTHDDGGLPEGVELVTWNLRTPSPHEAYDLIALPYLRTLDPVDALSRVRARLVQSPAIGYDGIRERLAPGHVFANGASVHETATSEHTLALVLAAQRGLPGMVLNQERATWPAPETMPGLADRRVLLIGYGGIGQAVAARLAPFEVRLDVVASRARTAEDGTRIRGPESLAELLPRAEIVIVIVPLMASTRHLINDDLLAQLPDGALVVNVSRGAVADTDAILRQDGRLRFALDVTDPEPLPPDHPLWRQEGVLISPHAAAATEALAPRWTALVRRQITRMLAGEPPINVVFRT